MNVFSPLPKGHHLVTRGTLYAFDSTRDLLSIIRRKRYGKMRCENVCGLVDTIERFYSLPLFVNWNKVSSRLDILWKILK